MRMGFRAVVFRWVFTAGGQSLLWDHNHVESPQMPVEGLAPLGALPEHGGVALVDQRQQGIQRLRIAAAIGLCALFVQPDHLRGGDDLFSVIVTTVQIQRAGDKISIEQCSRQVVELRSVQHREDRCSCMVQRQKSLAEADLRRSLFRPSNRTQRPHLHRMVGVDHSRQLADPRQLSVAA
ncbi:hypothetical protein D9M71_99970 [compost metagenome]